MSQTNASAAEPKKSIYPWLVVAAMFLVNFGSIGYTMASAGVYLVPQSMELGTDPGTLAWWLTLYGFGMAFILLFTGKLWQRFDARLLVTIGFLGQIIAVTLMGLYTELWQFYVSGVFIGLFGGLYYMIGAPFIANKWFVKKNGFALGVMNCGTGAGGIINPLILAVLIQNMGWRTTELIYGVILIVIIAPTAFILLRSNPADKGLKPYGWTPDYEANAATNTAALTGVSYKNAIKSAAFWCVFICAVAGCFFGAYNNFYPTFVNAWGYPPMFGALLVSLAGICNFLGPVTGGLSDAIGPKKTTIIIILLIAAGWAGWLFLGPGTAEPVIIFFMFLTSLQMVLVQVQLPLCAKGVFGLKDFERIWSTMMIGVGALSSFAAPIVAMPFAYTGNYYGSFVIGIGIAAVALITLLGMYGFGKKLQKEAGVAPSDAGNEVAAQ